MFYGSKENPMGPLLSDELFIIKTDSYGYVEWTENIIVSVFHEDHEYSALCNEIMDMYNVCDAKPFLYHFQARK